MSSVAARRAASATRLRKEANWREKYGLDAESRGNAKELGFGHMGETVFVRDRRLYTKKMTQLRKKYSEEFTNNLEARFFEFTAEVDVRAEREKQQLQLAQQQRRTKAIRRRELEAASAAAKTRKGMEKAREIDYMNFDIRDQRRDIIRGMLHEIPANTWLSKVNIAEKLNDSFLDTEVALSGLPKDGEYDTLHGLYNHTDVYFEGRVVTNDEAMSSITNQPFHNYKRKDDSTPEWMKEHSPYLAGLRKASNDFKAEKGKLMPSWWYKVDWDPIEEREPWIDDPVIFNDPETFLQEVDTFDDSRLLHSPAYWELLKYETRDRAALQESLQQAYDEVLELDRLVVDTLSDSIEKGEVNESAAKALKQDVRHHRWAAYNNFYKYMHHGRKLDWQSGKMNLDSQMRLLRAEIPKWKYMAFGSEEEYEHWKFRRSQMGDTGAFKDLTEQSEQVLTKLKETHYTGRQTGLPHIEAALSNVSPDVLKCFYLFAEELCDHAERMGSY